MYAAFCFRKGASERESAGGWVAGLELAKFWDLAHSCTKFSRCLMR